MNTTTLQKALDALQALPEDQQTTQITRFEDMIARAKIDAKLASSEQRGGATPADAFFSDLRSRYGN